LRLLAMSIWLSLLCCLCACRKMPYLPGEDAVIYLQASSSVIKLGERTLISIRGEKGSGYPLPNGTVVCLSASRGALPDEVILQDGKAVTEYQAEATFSGDVEIKARSGKSQIIPETLVITIADQVVDSLNIWAEPTQLPYGGGESQIQVLALDSLQKPVPGKVIFLSTSAGTLSGGGARTTDNNGSIQAYLYAEKAAVVTANYQDLECTVSIQIESQNINPVAEFSYSPLAPQSRETVYFNAASCTDSDGRIIGYKWDFGDGTSGTGETVSHVFTTSVNRTYTVVLKIMDDAGGEGVKSREIEVKAAI